MRFNGMTLVFKALQSVTVRYAIAIFSVLAVALICVKLFGIENPMWLLISCVISTDVDREQLKKNIISRTIATIIGVVVGVGALLFLGPGYCAFFIGVLLLVIVCQSIPFLLAGWRLTVVTGVIVLVGGLEQNSLAFSEHTAFIRATEVLAGSLIAGIISLLLNKVWLCVDKHGKSITANN